MQNLDSKDFTALPPAAAKKAALAAFDAALVDPHGTDWQSLAHMLHAALTAKRAAKAEAPADDGSLPWYAPERESYPKINGTRPRIDFTFADGITVSASAYQRAGKPINIGIACRIAFDMHRAKVRNRLERAFPEARLGSMPSRMTMGELSPLTVPAIVSAVYRDTGECWNVEILNRETAGQRVRRFDGLAALEGDDMEAAAIAVCHAFASPEHAADLAQWAAAQARARAETRRYRALERFGSLPHIAGDSFIGHHDRDARRVRLLDAVEAFEAMPLEEPAAPPPTPSRLRLVALRTTAYTPLRRPALAIAA
jgi:hypothetical protein